MKPAHWAAASRVAVTCLLSAAAVFLPADVISAREAGSQDRSGMQTYDDLLARVEEHAPGFGGMFIDSNGRLAVYLLDTTQLESARAAIESVFGSNRVPPAGVRAVQGQYAISQLRAWTERARAVMKMPGVILVDLDEAKNRVLIGVERRARTRAVERALSSMGIPPRAVVIEVTEQIKRVTP